MGCFVPTVLNDASVPHEPLNEFDIRILSRFDFAHRQYSTLSLRIQPSFDIFATILPLGRLLILSICTGITHFISSSTDAAPYPWPHGFISFHYSRARRQSFITFDVRSHTQLNSARRKILKHHWPSAHYRMCLLKTKIKASTTKNSYDTISSRLPNATINAISALFLDYLRGEIT
jgi:hypothetical protein